MNAIQTHLNLMDKEVKKKKCVFMIVNLYSPRLSELALTILLVCRYFKSKELVNFKRDCHNYFIEVVSTLCFGGQSAPEPALIKSLMEVVFTEDSDLVTPLIETKTEKRLKSEKVSVVRSSLLQLLLEHK